MDGSGGGGGGGGAGGVDVGASLVDGELIPKLGGIGGGGGGGGGASKGDHRCLTGVVLIREVLQELPAVVKPGVRLPRPLVRVEQLKTAQDRHHCRHYYHQHIPATVEQVVVN